MAGSVLHGEGFAVSFSEREVTAWGGLALFKQMLDSMGFREAAVGWGLPEPKSNRGYAPVQLIEQFIVSIWCGACRFVHAETVRMDRTLTRLFGWKRAAGHKAIMRLFARFDMLANERVQGLLRADSGFFDEAILAALEGKRIPYIIAARLTRPLQRTICQATGWWALETGLELTECRYQVAGWTAPRQLIVVRQSVKRKQAPGKTLALFADDPDIHGWRYGAFVTTLDLPMAEVWRTYRGRADCENRIKEPKADFGLEAFNLRDFWATEAALGFAMLAYNLMSLFRQAVLRSRIQHTLSTLRGLVLAIGGSWHRDASQNRLMLSVPRRKRAWFAGLWANASDPPVIPGLATNG